MHILLSRNSTLPFVKRWPLFKACLFFKDGHRAKAFNLFRQAPLLLALVLGPQLCQAQSAAPVSVTLPEVRQASGEMRLPGTIVAAKRTQLSARVSGAVDQIFVDAGATVTPGQTLLTLDSRLESIELQRLKAEAQAAQAQSQEQTRLVREAERLSKSQHIAQSQLDERRAAQARAEALMQAAEAEVDSQAQRVQWHTITAPFAGVIVRKLTEQGQWVTPGTPVFELATLNNSFIDVQVPQERFSALSKGAEINILIPGSQLPVAGKLVAQVPVADTSSRTFRVRVQASDSNALLPGAAVTVVFKLASEQKDILAIDRDAILRNPDNSFSVFVVVGAGREQQAERRQVSLGREFGRSVEVTQGIAEQDQVVIRGNELLRHQQTVTIVPQP